MVQRLSDWYQHWIGYWSDTQLVVGLILLTRRLGRAERG